MPGDGNFESLYPKKDVIQGALESCSMLLIVGSCFPYFEYYSKPGEIVYLDEPYGVFSIDRKRVALSCIRMVDRIGITPLMSMLRSIAARSDKRSVWFFNGKKNWGELVYSEELEAMRESLNLSLIHIVQVASHDWAGETGFLAKEVLKRHIL